VGSTNSDGNIQVMESLVYIALKILFSVPMYLRLTIFNLTNRKESSPKTQYKEQFFEDIIDLIYIPFT